MSKIYDFFRRFFSRKSNERNKKSLTIQDKETILADLRNEYGLDITHEMLSITDIQQKGYRKMLPCEVTQATAAFQFIPQLAVNAINNAAVNQSFQEAVKDTYRVVLEKGTHLAQSHKTPGAYRGVGLANANNQVGHGNPELFKNDAVLSISSGPQIALGIFNAVSFVTGQYFMSQVNSKLTDLKTGLDRIEQFLDIERRSEFQASINELEDIISKLDMVKKHQDQVTTTIEQIHAIQRSAQKTILFCREQAMREMQTASEKDKVDVIQAKLNTTGCYMLQYQCATQVYAVATMVEVQLIGITDPEELEVYRQQINNRVSGYKADCKNCYEAMITYLDNNHALNDKKAIEYIAAAGVGAAGGFFLGLWGIWPTIKINEKIGKLFAESRNKKKTEKQQVAQQYMTQLSDTDAIDAPCKAIENYIEVSRHPIEILAIEGDYYTNLPEPVAV